MDKTELNKLILKETKKVLKETPMDPELVYQAVYGIMSFVAIAAVYGTYLGIERVLEWSADHEIKMNNTTMMLNTPEMQGILRKFLDLKDPDNLKIYKLLNKGRVKEAAFLMRDTGRLTPEELKTLAKKATYFSGSWVEFDK